MSSFASQAANVLRFSSGASGAIGFSSTVSINSVTPEYLMIDGIRARLLKGMDEQPLKGVDGQYLYGRAA